MADNIQVCPVCSKSFANGGLLLHLPFCLDRQDRNSEAVLDTTANVKNRNKNSNRNASKARQPIAKRKKAATGAFDIYYDSDDFEDGSNLGTKAVGGVFECTKSRTDSNSSSNQNYQPYIERFGKENNENNGSVLQNNDQNHQNLDANNGVVSGGGVGPYQGNNSSLFSRVNSSCSGSTLMKDVGNEHCSLSYRYSNQNSDQNLHRNRNEHNRLQSSNKMVYHTATTDNSHIQNAAISMRESDTEELMRKDSTSHENEKLECSEKEKYSKVRK